MAELAEPMSEGNDRLNIERLEIPAVVRVTPRRFCDNRGFFSETFCDRDLAAAGLPSVFVQDNHSRSENAGTVRGLHMQAPPHAQHKLVRVTHGRILDVAVDIRVGSPTYGRHVAAELSAEDWAQLLVPIGFLHGFVTLEPATEVQYKVSDYYVPAAEGGVLWHDEALGIRWPVDVSAATVSGRDKQLPHFANFRSPFVYEGDGR